MSPLVSESPAGAAAQGPRELAALSPDNEAQFAGVVEALRAEVDAE